MEHHRPFDKGLDEVKKKLMHMAALAEGMIDGAIAELVKNDARLAERVPQQEHEINRLQIEVDEAVVALLATQQPVAGDLRFLLAATRINSDLERIGDLVINITQNVQTLVKEQPLKTFVNIPRMAELARSMVRESLDAFVARDPLHAQAVIMRDDEVDALKDRVVREMISCMIKDPSTIERALAIILVARHLERIADHATNIAQDVIYMIQGRDVRHPREKDVTLAHQPAGA